MSCTLICGGGGGAAALGYMAAAALDTGFCHLIGSISIFNLLFFHNFHIFLLFN
jgi:hypothetical protein